MKGAVIQVPSGLGQGRGLVFGAYLVMMDIHIFGGGVQRRPIDRGRDEFKLGILGRNGVGKRGPAVGKIRLWCGAVQIYKDCQRKARDE